MQRLFSTFPSGWPGLGLLLLRLVLAAYLFTNAINGGGASPVDVGLHALEWSMGALLIVGCWTPVVAIALSALLTYRITTAMSLDAAHLMPLVIGMSLSMLGPGSLSVDSLLFGRKRIEVPLPEDD